jgi:hypothetical protein
LVLEWVTTDDTSVWPVIDRLRRTYEPDSPLPGDGVMSS